MEYLDKYIFKISIVLLIIGALNWFSVGAFQINPVEKIFGFRSSVSRGLYVLVGISALLIMFNRDTYLPFLGETVMPCPGLPEQIPHNADTQVEVHVKPFAKVCIGLLKQKQKN
jgi:uncharacterized protein